jgi:sugar-specific transcriptional regulator TrmB
VQINQSRIRKVRDKIEEALEEVERLLEELEASRPVEPPPQRGVKIKRPRSLRRRVSEE